MAAENMLIAASILNVDSAFISGFDESEVREVLGIPDDYRPQGIIALGKAHHKATFPGKRELHEIIFLDEFGKKYPDMNLLKQDIRIIEKMQKHANLHLPVISSDVKEFFQKDGLKF
jgi:metallophosphoesterase superfamily enzyme